MKAICLVALTLVLGGCFKVEVVDKRLTREEVAGALAQRDKALDAIATKLIELQKGKDEKHSN